MIPRAFPGIGVVGCGKMGRDHVSSLLEDGRVQPVIWDISESIRKKVSQDYAVPAHATYEEMLADVSVMGLIIAAPNRFHAQMAVDALNAGKHVLLEKPMALNAEDAQRVALAAEESGKILHVGFELRNSLFPREVKKLIADGELGELLSAHVVEYRGHFWPEWKGQKSDGGSMYLMESCHMIDLFRWWSGSEVERIHAAGSRKNIARHYEYPDTQFTTFVFRNGFVGHILACHARSAMPDMELDAEKFEQACYEPQMGHQYEYSLVGENGSLHFLPLRKVCHLYRHELREDGSVWQRFERVIDYSHFADHRPTIHDTSGEIRHFVEMVLGEEEPSIDPRDALLTHLTCFKAQEALESEMALEVSFGADESFTGLSSLSATA